MSLRVRWLAGSTLVFASSVVVVSCSLAHPPSELFLEDGSLVTLARVARADGLALTKDAVFIAVGAAVLRVPRGGGDARAVYSGESLVTSLVGDLNDAVFFCSGGSVRGWDDRLNGPALLPADLPPDPCEAVAVGDDDVAVTFDPGGARLRRNVRWTRRDPSRVSKFDISAAFPGVASVAVLGDRVYFGAGGALGYVDPSVRATGTFCDLASYGTREPPALLVARSASGTLLLARTTLVFRAFVELPQSACFPGNIEAPLARSLEPAATATTNGGFVYQVRGARIERFAVEDATRLLQTARSADRPAWVPVVANLGGDDVRFLAVDGDEAFFVAGDRLQRARIDSL